MKRLGLSLAMVVLVGGCAGDDGATTTTVSSFAVSGYAHAGPVCPVETIPHDPACDDRPVSDAVLHLLDASGTVVAEVTTAADGTFTLTLPAGTYTLVPQPVEGLMGTAEPVEVIVDGPIAGIDIAYDTGIR